MIQYKENQLKNYIFYTFVLLLQSNHVIASNPDHSTDIGIKRSITDMEVRWREKAKEEVFDEKFNDAFNQQKQKFEEILTHQSLKTSDFVVAWLQSLEIYRRQTRTDVFYNNGYFSLVAGISGLISAATIYFSYKFIIPRIVGYLEKKNWKQNEINNVIRSTKAAAVIGGIGLGVITFVIQQIAIFANNRQKRTACLHVASSQPVTVKTTTIDTLHL